MSDASDWVTAIATCIGTVAVAGGLFFTAYQIKLASEAQEANVIYNAQKDYHDLFIKTDDADFQQCFGGTSSVPNPCTSSNARDIFFDILNYFQLLTELQKLHAVEEQYVNSRARQFCPLLKQGTFTFDQFHKQHLVSDELTTRLSELCGAQL